MLNESVSSANTILQNTLVVGLLQNTAILLSLSLLYESVWLKTDSDKPWPARLLAGFVIGLIAIVLMKTPWTYVPGIVFDTRSVLLAISGLFFGAIPTIIAMLMAIAVRLYDAGDGMWMGLAVIVSSGTIGILWQKLRPVKATQNHALELLWLGITVHAFMLACTAFLPKHSSWDTFMFILFPLILVYTPATVLLGLLMIRQKKNQLNRIAATKLRDSEQKFRNLFDNHSAVKLIIDPDNGQIMDANQAATRFYGWSREELKNMKISDINTLNQDLLNLEIAKVLNNTRIHFEFQHRCKDGRIIDVETFSSKIDFGGKTCLHSIIHDVSEKKQLMVDLVAAKERAEQNDKLKTLFLMNMSHEIRTPLNGIMGFASILADGDTDPEQTKEFSLIIQKSGQRLLSLINDMIDVSKIESGAEKLYFDEVNAEGLLYDATQQFEAQAARKGLTLHMSIPQTHPNLMFWCDARKLNQIITNLINNAIKFSDKGTIETGYLVDNQTITFFIKDQGIGIPEEYQDQVFNRFFQAHRQDSSGNPGTGLGLTICKGLATLLGGSIRLESIPGTGTTFFLSLPLRESHPA